MCHYHSLLICAAINPTSAWPVIGFVPDMMHQLQTGCAHTDMIQCIHICLADIKQLYHTGH
jgi:hypothetical protein